MRDVYYVAPVATTQRGANIRNETGVPHFSQRAANAPGQVPLVLFYENPTMWETDGKKLFTRNRETTPLFELGENQYFPMGDNSPASQDARIWSGPKFVDGEYLIGRAMFIYWPHSLNRPITYFPNFRRMGFIR